MGLLDDILARIGQGAYEEGAPARLAGYWANEGLPPPPAAAMPDFTLAVPAPKSSEKRGSKVSFPPPQGFSDAMTPQGFGDAAPLAAPAAAASPGAPPVAAPSGAVPSWLGMLNGAPMPKGMDAEGYPVPPAAAAPASRPSAPPPAAAPASPPSSQGASVPETSLAGRLGGGFGDLLNGFNDWRNNNRLTLMALGAGMAGAQNLGQGLNRGMTMALPAMQQDIALQHQNQTVSALMRRGMPQEVALAAATNPAIMQQLVPQIFGPKQWNFTTIGHDQYGQPIMGWVNPVTRQVTDPSGKPVTSATPGVGQAAASPADMEAHGEDFLKTLDPSRAALVRSITQGRAPYPSGMMLKTPYGEMLQQQITQAEPGFNAQTFQQRQKAFNYWYGGGKGDEIYKRLDQAMDHAGALTRSVDQLGNGQFPAANYVLNKAGEAIGKPTSAPLATNAHALADELGAIWKGANLSDSEIKAWSDAFPVQGSVAQQKAAVGKLIELIEGGMNALKDQRERDLGPAADQLPDLVTQRTQGILDGLKQWVGGQSRPSSVAGAPVAAAPAHTGAVPGGHYQWTPDRGLTLVQ